MRDQIARIYDTPQPNEQIAASMPGPASVPDPVPEPAQENEEERSPLAMPKLPTVEVEEHEQPNKQFSNDYLQTKTPSHGRVIHPINKPVEQNAETLYDQTHAASADARAFSEDTSVNQQWKQYHTAWQSYYQQYYERYYLAQVQLQQSHPDPTEPAQKKPAASEPLTKDQAVTELRSDLMRKVEEQTKMIKKSRHFVPAMVGLSVFGLLIFLQYNPFLFASLYAWTTPASTLSPNIIIDPGAGTKVSPEPRIIVPKINVDAPVVYDVNTLAEPVIQERLKEGVVHYPIPGANAFPGQIGNSVVLGHSSNDVFDTGQYKFIFVQLSKLDKGDVFYLHYNGTRYTYSVTEKKIIDPTEVNQLVLNNGKPMATLVTCDPPGTALKRLIVIGEQISPDPAKANVQTDEQKKTTDTDATRIGGDTRSFFERLFSPTN